MDELKVILDMLRAYGGDGALLIIVGALMYGVKVVRELAKSLSVNPQLNEHLVTQEKLLTDIRDDLRVAGKRLEDIWQEVRK